MKWPQKIHYFKCFKLNLFKIYFLQHGFCYGWQLLLMFIFFHFSNIFYHKKEITAKIEGENLMKTVTKFSDRHREVICVYVCV